VGHDDCRADARPGVVRADISYNAIANLGYADVRFLRPDRGDTWTQRRSDMLICEPNPAPKRNA
jgi:hypothetical protein